MKIGFIGLGIMGKPMARNLIKAGHELSVYDRSRTPVEELAAAGARAAGSSREAAEFGDILITMLPNSPHVKAAVLGEGGALEGLGPGKVLVDMSSIAPGAAKEIAEALAAKGVDMLDAPVSGGEPKAVEGTLSIMVGGKSAVFERCLPVLKAMGSSAVLCGEIGAGNTTKLANQIVVALNIAALSEAMVLASKAGVDPDTLFKAIRGGLAGSTVMEAKAPMIMAGNFKPGFRIELHIKDLANALETGHEIGVPLPLTSQVMEIMQALKVEGKAGDDHSGLVQFYEKLARHEARKRP